MCDGSVHSVASTVSAVSLWAAANPSDGYVPGPDF
jgi:hypothetical protein